MSESAAPIRTHKGLGIASFVITLVTTVILFLDFGIGGYLGVTHQGSAGANVIIGLVLFLGWFLDLIALIFGVIGLFDNSSKKAFPIAGVLIAVLGFGFSQALMLVGLAAMHGRVPQA